MTNNKGQITKDKRQMTTTLKEFLEACETLGTLRLIVTSSAAVLEARGKIEKLFYAELPKGKYANMHTEGFEFHLNMDKITQVKFETGEAKRGNFTTYAIRFLDDKQEPALSLFLQWGKPGEYEPGQVEAWETLKKKYGDIWEPLPAEI
ncbi:ChuX/HutX family heme-like substrate-binding protein [Nostoc sp.]